MALFLPPFLPSEIDPYLRRLLKSLGVECVDAREVEKEHPCCILCGWELKPFSTLYSPFEEVLFLDADCGPCRDVTEVFSWPEYLEKGAIFWPDYACWQLKRDVWEIFDIPEVAARWQSEVAFESGQYLINKTRCWSELRMARWYAEHSDFVFRVVYGDKECFHLGWRKLGSDATDRLCPSLHRLRGQPRSDRPGHDPGPAAGALDAVAPAVTGEPGRTGITTHLSILETLPATMLFRAWRVW